jgi:hypothetical protein
MPHTQQIWAVDQLGDDWASVEVDGNHVVRIPRWLLPSDVREGNVYQVRQQRRAGRSVVTVTADAEEEARRLERSRRQVERPLPSDPGGDIQL